MDDVEVVPESDHVVRVRKDQFDMLQLAVNEAVEDVTALASLLGFQPPQGMPPYEVMRRHLLPMVAILVSTQSKVNAASKEIGGLVDAARKRGGHEIDLGDGRKAVLAGKRDPSLTAGLQPLTRRQRREWDRRHGT